MPSAPPVLYPRDQQLLTEFGERLRLARLRRDMSMETVAARAAISRTTLQRAEAGSAAISMGVYLRILGVFHLAEDLGALAKDDALGRRLQDLALPVRRRARKKAPYE